MRVYLNFLGFLAVLSLAGFNIEALSAPNGLEKTESAYSPERISLWLDGFRARAIEDSISPEFFDKAFTNFVPNPKVIDAANYQPEFKTPPGEYIKKLVSNIRIDSGKKLLHEKAEMFEKLERLYGVDRHILVAIWGIETNYGKQMGGHNAVYALATLALDGNRKEFAENQLLALLKILEKEGLPIESDGSWAGAMGQMQFIPTTYIDYARDVDGDGVRDIWNSLEDSLGSAAYYLKRSGWVSGMMWGIEVAPPQDYLFGNKNDEENQSIVKWLEAGYKPAFGLDARNKKWQGESAHAVHIAPHAPIFLVTKNFKALLRYNNATIYALAVGRLADRLRGAQLTKTAWLEKPLESFTKEEIKIVQASLYQLGFEAGEIDGIIGINTIKAFNAWQEKEGLAKTKITDNAISQLNKQASTLNGDEIKLLQKQLIVLGFYASSADGFVGPKTRAALREFQKAEGFSVDGSPSRVMLALIKQKIEQSKEELNDIAKENIGEEARK